MNQNPFNTEDSDRYKIWEMLVKRDIRAFIQEDWSMIANDFIEENFMGIDANRTENPDRWKLKFPDLDTYKKEWLRQAQGFGDIKWEEDIETALYRITTLKKIEICGNSALAHKHFSGYILKTDGDKVSLNWQTLYRCRNIDKVWKIAGFCGYMPNYSAIESDSFIQLVSLPAGASQHKTAGPYSPVLVVKPGQLVVISGQAAIDNEGQVLGETIEDQARHTMENCRKQLDIAGCDLDNVFKVNVYLENLDDWPRFNEVYKSYFSDPLPVRTAVQTGLLMELAVEIEMWAVKT